MRSKNSKYDIEQIYLHLSRFTVSDIKLTFQISGVFFKFWVSFSDFGCFSHFRRHFFRYHVDISFIRLFFPDFGCLFQILGVFFRFWVSFSDFGCPFQILAVLAVFGRYFSVIMYISFILLFFQILGVLFRFRTK